MGIRRRITSDEPIYPKDIRNDGYMQYIKGDFYVRKLTNVDRERRYHVFDGRVAPVSRTKSVKPTGRGYETLKEAAAACDQMAARAYTPKKIQKPAPLPENVINPE